MSQIRSKTKIQIHVCDSQRSLTLCEFKGQYLFGKAQGKNEEIYAEENFLIYLPNSVFCNE